MRKQLTAYGCFFVVCLALVLAIPAQADFIYRGTVTCCENGDPIPGQCVFFVDARNRLAEVVTNESGEFVLEVLEQGPNSPGWFLTSYAWLSTCNGDGEQLDTEVCSIDAPFPTIHPASGEAIANIGPGLYDVDPNEAVCFFWEKDVQEIDEFEVHFQIPGCTEEETIGCTYTIGWYKSHNRFARQDHKQIPWPIDEETLLCGEEWLTILKTPPEGNAWYILAHQWIGATLNVANGASTTPEVAMALAEGQALLEECSIAGEDRELAIYYSELLDMFNNGEIGPGHCDSVQGDDDDDDDDEEVEVQTNRNSRSKKSKKVKK
jgi:hypothetical protein